MRLSTLLRSAARRQCQDLSVAGAREGIHKGKRSSLFFEAIRIIKEMREATNGKYPRFAIWENVPGAFSSNKGEDFRAVLQAFCGVCDETVSVPRSRKWLHAGAIVGDSYSVAWRVYDAQYWGVPQRRRRVYLIADFRGECAGEVLFKPESVLWHPSKSGGAWETASRTPEEGTGSTVNCVLASSAVNAEMTGGDISPTLLSRAGTGGNQLPLINVETPNGTDN